MQKCRLLTLQLRKQGRFRSDLAKSDANVYFVARAKSQTTDQFTDSNCLPALQGSENRRYEHITQFLELIPAPCSCKFNKRRGKSGNRL
jgi:hypothetical protein